MKTSWASQSVTLKEAETGAGPEAIPPAREQRKCRDGFDGGPRLGLDMPTKPIPPCVKGDLSPAVSAASAF